MRRIYTRELQGLQGLESATIYSIYTIYKSSCLPINSQSRGWKPLVNWIVTPNLDLFRNMMLLIQHPRPPGQAQSRLKRSGPTK